MAARPLPPLDELPAQAGDGTLHALIESPAGSTVRIAHDPRLGVFMLRRSLATPASS